MVDSTNTGLAGTTVGAAAVKSAAGRELLAQISADEYNTWFRVGCALKHLGEPYEVFRDWSATSDKFDEDECKQKWDELPDEPRSGITTLRELAHTGVSFIEPPSEMLPAPASEEEQIQQSAGYFTTLFQVGDAIEFCGARQNKDRWVPARAIQGFRLDETDTLEALIQNDVLRGLIQNEKNGVYAGFNPCALADVSDQQVKAPTDKMVTDHRYALLECDTLAIDEQWGALRKLRLPIAMVIHSGNKSLHTLVKVDAGDNSTLYAERVAKLHAYANEHGLPVDPACKNPSRLTRLPGGKRGDAVQYTVTTAWGYESWADFERYELHQSTESIAADAPPTVNSSEDDALIAEYGAPFEINKAGKATNLNQVFFAAYITRFCGVRMVDGLFYRYEASTGLWCQQKTANLLNTIAQTIRDYGRAHGVQETIVATTGTCKSIREFIQGGATPFRKPKRCIHVANGMLEFGEDGESELKPFSPAYCSRNRTEITYTPGATCPRFLDSLLRFALPEDDIDILQRYCGQCLLGDNFTQTILVLTGTSGAGKGTIVNIIEKVIGKENCVQLRTVHLNEKFETSRYVGKTLLGGKDVHSDFLQQKAASTIKSLCGNDRLSTETKGSQDYTDIEGRFNIVITSNEHLHIALDGDEGAWKRRLLLLFFSRPAVTPEKKVDDFDEVLLREEGPGILNWMIEGAKKVLTDGFPVNAQARQRVDELLRESDSIYAFLRECIVKAPGEQMTTSDLLFRYESWCVLQGWQPLEPQVARQQLDRGVQRLFCIAKSHDIAVYGGVQRGFRGIAYNPPVNGGSAAMA